MTKKYWVYILTTKKNTSLYIGVTSNLSFRIYQHKTGQIQGFTKKYNVTKLIYLEEYQRVEEAIVREKQLKSWNRNWKEELIGKRNKEWKELEYF